jgi:hypothetical protein
VVEGEGALAASAKGVVVCGTKDAYEVVDDGFVVG